MPYVFREPTRTKFLKLRQPASIEIETRCGDCQVEVEWDDRLYCPSCGTEWHGNPATGDQGEIHTDNWDDDRFEDTTTENTDASLRGGEAVQKLVYQPFSGNGLGF